MSGRSQVRQLPARWWCLGPVTGPGYSQPTALLTTLPKETPSPDSLSAAGLSECGRCASEHLQLRLHALVAQHSGVLFAGAQI